MQKSLKIAAKAGNPKAIQQLLTKGLQSQGITAQAIRHDTKLIILLSAETTPDSRLINRIKKGLDKIQPQGIRTVTIRAQTIFSTKVVWTKQWYLAPPTLSTHHQLITTTTSDRSASSASRSQKPSTSDDAATHLSVTDQTIINNKHVTTPAVKNIWRSQNWLVMRRDAQLPDRCIKTNQPAHGKRYTLELRWLPRWLWLFLGVFWVMIAIFLSQKVTVDVGITATQLKKIRRRVVWGWTLAALGLILWAIPWIIPIDQLPDWSTWVAILGLLLFILGPFISLVVARPVGIVQIKGDFIWLRGVSQNYLNCLPKWQPDNQKQDTKIARVKSIKPWHRFEARFFDSLIASISLVFFLAAIAPSLLEIVDSSDVGYRLYFFMVVSFNAILLEPILLCSWGTTPGKALLGIQVRHRNGEKLSYLQAMNRSIAVSFGGMALGFYPISFLTMFLGYQKLTQKGITTWDQAGGFKVSHRKISGLRRIIRACIVHIFVFLTLTSFLLTIDEILVLLQSKNMF